MGRAATGSAVEAPPSAAQWLLHQVHRPGDEVVSNEHMHTHGGVVETRERRPHVSKENRACAIAVEVDVETLDAAPDSLGVVEGPAALHRDEAVERVEVSGR